MHNNAFSLSWIWLIDTDVLKILFKCKVQYEIDNVYIMYKLIQQLILVHWIL